MVSTMVFDRTMWYVDCLFAGALDVYYLYRGRNRTCVPMILRHSIKIRANRIREMIRIREEARRCSSVFI